VNVAEVFFFEELQRVAGKQSAVEWLLVNSNTSRTSSLQSRARDSPRTLSREGSATPSNLSHLSEEKVFMAPNSPSASYMSKMSTDGGDAFSRASSSHPCSNCSVYSTSSQLSSEPASPIHINRMNSGTHASSEAPAASSSSAASRPYAFRQSFRNKRDPIQKSRDDMFNKASRTSMSMGDLTQNRALSPDSAASRSGSSADMEAELESLMVEGKDRPLGAQELSLLRDSSQNLGLMFTDAAHVLLNDIDLPA